MGWIGNGGPELGRAGVDGTMPDRTSRHTSRSRNRGESGNSVPSSSRYLAAMAIAMAHGKERQVTGSVGISDFLVYFVLPIGTLNLANMPELRANAELTAKGIHPRSSLPRYDCWFGPCQVVRDWCIGWRVLLLCLLSCITVALVISIGQATCLLLSYGTPQQTSK